MPRTEDKYIVALDIGTSKVCALVGEISDRGQLEIIALRKEAEARLGARFDLKAFHDVVLGQGAVTLPVLRTQVEAWIQSASSTAARSE